LVTHGLQNRPELLEGRHKLQASEELLTAVRSLHYGSVSGVGVLAVSKFWDVHDGGLHNNEVAPFWGLGATGRLPLFAGFKIQQQVREAEALKGEAEEDLRDIANDVVMQVIRAYLAVTSNAEQVGLEEERVKVAREALQLAQDRYRLGLSSIIDVIQATTMLYEAEARLAESQALYRISQSAVAYAAGQDYRRY
jgi:outer membrane protein